MNEDVRKVLECQNWDLVKIFKKVPITKFIDQNGEVWDVKLTRGPCGCCLETEQNAFRTFLWCPKHPDLGILVYGYRENSWFWVPNKLEGK